jgi:hypothetical protein
MSTKNLARTVIEGGRTRGNRYDRRASNQGHRRRVHQVSCQLTQVSNYDSVLYPKRRLVNRMFDDKLGPAWRWLASQVGRPWDKGRSELFQRFDIRTTAGRHIVFDHVLRDVATERDRGWGWPNYRVATNGVLRKRPPRPHSGGSAPRAPLPEPLADIEAWLNGRQIALRGRLWFWFELTEAGFFRQSKALSDADSARWLALPQWYREGK